MVRTVPCAGLEDMPVLVKLHTRLAGPLLHSNLLINSQATTLSWSILSRFRLRGGERILVAKKVVEVIPSWD
jgi:hypothetical protein